KRALEAAEFYVSLFPNSAIDNVHKAVADYPGGKAGNVLLVSFTLANRSYQALNGGPYETFNDAISLSVSCEGQAEVDRLWEALTADGGKPIKCGWLKDKFGVAWQIVPKRLPELLWSTDPEKARRVMEAIFKMVKLDIAALERA